MPGTNPQMNYARTNPAIIDACANLEMTHAYTNPQMIYASAISQMIYARTNPLVIYARHKPIDELRPDKPKDDDLHRRKSRDDSLLYKLPDELCRWISTGE
jgi:hypothetical protein